MIIQWELNQLVFLVNFTKTADRMIVALVRRTSYPLITADKKILAYKHVKMVWYKGSEI